MTVTVFDIATKPWSYAAWPAELIQMRLRAILAALSWSGRGDRHREFVHTAGEYVTDIGDFTGRADVFGPL